MLDLSDLLKNSIPNYPNCPVERLCNKIASYEPEEIDEKKVLEFLSDIKKHEDELRAFRKGLEVKFLEYQVYSIVNEEKQK